MRAAGVPLRAAPLIGFSEHRCIALGGGGKTAHARKFWRGARSGIGLRGQDPVLYAGLNARLPRTVLCSSLEAYSEGEPVKWGSGSQNSCTASAKGMPLFSQVRKHCFTVSLPGCPT
jgi:hypothetical protein